MARRPTGDVTRRDWPALRASSTDLTCVCFVSFWSSRGWRRHASLTFRVDARPRSSPRVAAFFSPTSPTTTTRLLPPPLQLIAANTPSCRAAHSFPPLFSRPDPARLPRRMRARPHIVDVVRSRDFAGRGTSAFPIEHLRVSLCSVFTPVI